MEARWVDALAAITSIQPAGVVIAETDSVDTRIVAAFAQQISRAQPFVPVIVRMHEDDALPYKNALSIAADEPIERLIARLVGRAARARTCMRQCCGAWTRSRWNAVRSRCSRPSDPLEDATVLVLGRGRSYPTLSVAVGERVGVIGALSVEAAGRCLAAREIDAIVIGDGFSPRIIDAFLIVLAEDARFRDLAVGVLGDGAIPAEMPNVLRARDPLRLVERILPLTRLHAYDERLKRMIKSLECNGMIDPETGLLN